MSRFRWVALVLAIAVTGAGVATWRFFEVCSSASRAALTETPVFEGAEIDPDPNFLDSDDVCVARFETEAPADAVLAHYERQLTAQGWNVRRKSPQQIADESGCGDDQPDCPDYRGLQATRGGMCLGVDTEHYPGGAVPDRKAVYLQAQRC